MKRMGLKKFRRLVACVMETLPEEVRAHLRNVVVDVELEPDLDTLYDAGLTDEEIDEGGTLYGYCVPMALPMDGIDVPDLPHRLIIYKRPLEDDYEGRDLLLEIRMTVIHELAHAFGWSERDLEAFESKDDPFGDDEVARLLEELWRAEE